MVDDNYWETGIEVAVTQVMDHVLCTENGNGAY